MNSPEIPPGPEAPPRRPAALVAALGLAGAAVFVAIAVRMLKRSPSLKEYLFDSWDPFWLKCYAAATAAVGLLVWWRRGRLLFPLAVAASLGLVLTPAVLGPTGWALPKLLLITALAVGLGQRCLRWTVGDAEVGPLDRVLLAAVLGYGVLCLVLLGMGLLHLWRAPVVAAVLVVLGAAVARDFAAVCRQAYAEGARPLVAGWRGADLRLASLALACFCICGFGCYLYSVAPATHWDVLHYHLGIPAIYVARGGMVNLDHTFAAQLIRNSEMLYVLGLLVEGQPLPLLFNFLFGVLAAGMVVALGTRLAGRPAGVLAGCIFFALPLGNYVLAEGMIDVALTAYVLASAYAFVRWQEDGRSGWLVLFSLLAGLAAGTKINAGVFLGPLAAVAVVRVLGAGGGGLARLAGLARVVLPGLLAVGPWLALTWVRTGNPVFPFLNNFFRSPEWMADSITPGVDWAGFGVGKTWRYLFRLPWDLTFRGERFGELGWFATAGVAALGLPLTYFLADRRQRRAMLGLSCLVGIGLALFFGVAQYARYMLPLFAFAAIVAGINCECLWRLCGRLPLRQVPLALCVLLGLSWLLFTRAVHVSTMSYYHPGRYPWELALGRQTPDEFLRKSALQEYEFLKFLREEIPDKPVVYLDIGLGSGLYSGDAQPYSRWHSLAGKAMSEERSPEKLLGLLREKGIRYVAVYRSFVMRDAWFRDLLRTAAVLNGDFLDKHTELVYSRNGIYLYRLHYDEKGPRPANRQSALKNTDLRPGENGSLPDWGLPGKITIEPNGHPGDRSATAVHLGHTNCICQRCPARENTLYTLSADFWAPEPGQFCMLQILWVDESGKQVKNEFLELEVGPTPQRYEIASTSVPGTRHADVYVRAKDGSRVIAAKPRLIDWGPPPDPRATAGRP